ncbi:MAG: Nif11 family protein [Lachnospiraceae bacterium]|nr:Nif11 family protein [Lachnospiraceae bacterium]
MNNGETIFTEELMHKARECKSPEEIIALAKENGVDITEAQAEEYFKMLSPVNGELADEELDNVSGGCETVTVKAVDEKGNIYSLNYLRVETYTVCFTGYNSGTCSSCDKVNYYEDNYGNKIYYCTNYEV